MPFPSVKSTDDRNAVIVKGADGHVTISSWELSFARDYFGTLKRDSCLAPELLADAVEHNMDKVAIVAPEHQMNYVEDCLSRLNQVCGKEEVEPADIKLMEELVLSIIESADNFRVLLQNLTEQHQIFDYTGEMDEGPNATARDWFWFGSLITGHLAHITRSRYQSIHSRQKTAGDSQKNTACDHVTWSDLAKIINEVRPPFLNVPDVDYALIDSTRTEMFIKAQPRYFSLVCLMQNLFYIQTVGALEQEFGVLDLLSLLSLKGEAHVSDLISSSGLVPKDYILFEDFPEGQSEEDKTLARLVFVPESDQSARNADQLRVLQQARTYIDNRTRVWIGDSA